MTTETETPDPEGPGASSPPPHRQATTPTSATNNTGAPRHVAAMNRRREASRRMQALWCGCRDPLSVAHRRWHLDDNGDEHNIDGDDRGGDLGDQQLDAWSSTASHLLRQNLTPAVPPAAQRGMWRRGGQDRAIVAQIRDRAG